MIRNRFLPLVIFLCHLLRTVVAPADEPAFQPDQSVLPAPRPDGAIVLLDAQTVEFRSKQGTEIDWPSSDGMVVSKRGEARSNHIVSTWHFRDADIHAEFMLPEKGSGNSGLYIHGNYELQIIDSFGNSQPPGKGDMGALYGFANPLVNAARPKLQWQVYDVRYRAPRRDASGQITAAGTLTAWLNGKCVQDGVEFREPRSRYHPYRYRTTEYLSGIWKRQQATSEGPLFLQDHDSPVRFRNVWIVPLDNRAHRYEPASTSSEP